MNRQGFSLWVGAVGLVAVCTFAPLALGCAMVSLAKDTTGDHVEAERALIIWDEEHHIEHFIRQASFHAMQPEVEFLVPTPETPEVAEVDPAIFDIVNRVGRHELTPPIIYHTPWEAVPVLLFGVMPDSGRRTYVPDSQMASARWDIDPWKQTTGTEETATYRATSLDPADFVAVSAVIGSWSNQKDVTLSAPLTAWLKVYAAKGWKMTAFDFKQDSNSWPPNRLTAPAIRLSFHTDKPYYPYCEPKDRQNPDKASPFGRALRVAILSNHRMTAQLADSHPWPGQLMYAGPSLSSVAGSGQTASPAVNQMTFPAVATSTLATSLPEEKPASEEWLQWAGLNDPKYSLVLPSELTLFVDNADPRPGTSDLYFTPDSNSGACRGQEIDYRQQRKYLMDYSHPLLNMATGLILFLVPVAPLYCGCYVLRRRWRQARHPTATFSPLNPQTKWVRVLFGVSAILLGILYGGQVLFIGVGRSVSVMMEAMQSDKSSYGFALAATPLLLLFTLAFFLIFWSGVYCGVRVIRQEPFSESMRKHWKLLCAEGRWSGYMGISCVLIGAIALIFSLFLTASVIAD